MEEQSRLYNAQGIGKRLVSGMRQAENFAGIILTATLFWDMTSCHLPEERVLNHFAVETPNSQIYCAQPLLCWNPKFTDILCSTTSLLKPQIHRYTVINHFAVETPCWPLVPEFAGSHPAEVVGFFGHLKNPPHAFLRRGSERICPMSQLCGM